MRMTGRDGVLSISDGPGLAADSRLDLRSWRVPALALGTLLACVAVLALGTLLAPTAVRSHALVRANVLQGRAPISLLAAASASIGSSEHGFWPVRRGRSVLAEGGGIHSAFTASGAELRVPQGTLGLALAAVGRGQRLEALPPVAPTTAANQVLYRHGSIIDFYRNGPYGLEQGFTVRKRPHAGGGSLTLTLHIAGTLIGGQVGSQVLFKNRSGSAKLRYSQLTALDATGRRLPARMQLQDRTLLLIIDDRNAKYPLSVDPFISDPFIQQGEKLTGNGAIGRPGAAFGSQVAVSSDGNTALIGGPEDHPKEQAVGAAWVFTRSGSTWTQQGSKLIPSDESGDGAYFGRSVALSSDGNTALIGGSSDYPSGAAWVFTRSGLVWTQQEKLISGESVGSFGWSVALSADGRTALIGDLGAVWLFTHSGSTWTREELTRTGESGGSFGSSVALSSDGNTALIGAPEDNNVHVGAAWVFMHSGSTWTQEKLTGSGENGEGWFGSSVALSADGSTALIGGLYDNGGLGAAWVFKRSGSTWSQLGSKLTGIGELGEGSGQFGSSVALADNGNAALVGGPGDNSPQGSAWGVGAAWVFTRSGSTWTELEKLSGGGGELGAAGFGESVGLSSDGNIALIGGSHDDGTFGAAWVFAHPPPTVATGAASAVANSAAMLTATVNPNGGAVGECSLEYGTTTSYGASASCTPRPGSGTSPVAVSASVAGLAANTIYHFRVSATNPAGTSYGSDQTLQTPPNPPAVVTRAASSVSVSYATLNATVNPNGGQVTTCRFEYGTSVSYGSTTLCSSVGQTGESPVAVFASVGVTANTTYHFRIVATNAGGMSFGSDETLTTPPPPPPRVESSMTWSFEWSRRYTIVRSLTVHAVPKGGYVEASCKGRGCPFALSRSARVARLKRCRGKKCTKRHALQGPTVSLASLFKGRHLGVGARISVSVVKAGWVGKSFVFTVRASGPPSPRVACLAPGSSVPNADC
jgi:hypothetical protein